MYRISKLKKIRKFIFKIEKQHIPYFFKLKDDQDLNSQNLYFDSEQKFNAFVRFCDRSMVPIVCSWCSNFNNPAIRCRVYSLTSKQQKCEEAESKLEDLTKKIPTFLTNCDKIQINTIEQLRLLYTVSSSLEESYFKGPKRIYKDIAELSVNGCKQETLNMNMYFNKDIRKIGFEDALDISTAYDIFNKDGPCLCVEYPYDIQIKTNGTFRKVLVEIAKRNSSSGGRLSSKSHKVIKYGFKGFSNIKSKYMKNYFCKYSEMSKNKCNESYNVKDEVKTIAKGIEYIFNLLYPFLAYLIDRLGYCYQSPGYSVVDCARCTSFKDTAASLCADNQLKNWISNLELSLPGYDSKIPKVILEYRENTYDHKLYKFVQDNIDSFEEYPCLNEFREFLGLSLFSTNHYSIDEPNNSFTLRNCWMIQGLGTLKLLTDIDQNTVLDGFEFTQFKNLEEADDKGEFYQELEKDKDDKNKIKNIFIECYKSFINNDEIKANVLVNKFKLYKLKNISTFIAYNAIKYFYHVICKKGREQENFKECMEKYEVEEVYKCILFRVDIDKAYKIIHSRSYSDVLFSIAEIYNYNIDPKSEYRICILSKRLKLKCEIEDENYEYGEIKSKFFLPGFLPIYASIPDMFKEVFEDDYINTRDNVYELSNGVLNVNVQLFAKDIKLALEHSNNFEFIKESIAKAPKLISYIGTNNSNNDEIKGS